MNCKTRWNSTYNMISHACVLKDYIEMLLVKHQNLKNFFLNEHEWEGGCGNMYSMDFHVWNVWIYN